MIAPPILVSFSSLQSYLDALDNDVRIEYQDEITALYEKGLPPIVSSRALACLFGFSTKFVNSMKYRNANYYRSFTIRNGSKKRKIHAPRVAIKVIQKWFGHHLGDYLKFDDHVFGFIPGKSHIDAAAVHVNAKWVYSVDIKDFFSTTPSEIVIEKLVELGYSQKAAELIVPLCCYKKHLAQGAPSSPILSNLVMQDIDVKLNSLADEYNVRFSRYADDIVFSSQKDGEYIQGDLIDIPEGLKLRVKSLFENSCWKLSSQKEYSACLPQRLKVHGLMVQGEKPILTKGYRNKIRAFEHMIKQGKVNNDSDIKRIKGHIHYSKSVDGYNKTSES